MVHASLASELELLILLVDCSLKAPPEQVLRDPLTRTKPLTARPSVRQLKHAIKSNLVSVGRVCLGERAKEMLFRGAIAVMREPQRDEIFAKYGVASHERTLRQMQRLGFDPSLVLDIGAYEGHWTRMLKGIFPKAHVLMLDAQREKESYLETVRRQFESTVDYKIALLGAEPNDRAVFFQMETGSSVLPEQSAVARKRLELRMQCLDDVVQECRFVQPFQLIKLDVQGYELEILRGGRKVLAGAEAALLEVSLLPINVGAPLLAEVVVFMNAAGFRAYDISSFIRRPLDGALWAVDIMFVRETSRLLRSTRFDA